MASVPEELRTGLDPTTDRGQIAVRLEQVRAATLDLITSLSEDALNRVHDPLMSPIVWDLGHIGSFEDLWLAQNSFERPPLRAELDDVYDPFTAPRSERGELSYLRFEDCLSYLDAVRARTLGLLSEADLDSSDNELLRDGYSFELVLMHERQHQETILQTLQLMTSENYELPTSDNSLTTPKGPEMVLVPAGEVEVGTNRLVFSYDNERPANMRDCAAFWIDRTPVSYGAFAEFVDAGGYDRRELWSAESLEWLAESKLSLPRYWRRSSEGYEVRRFSEWLPLPADQPVCHVTWFEADAFARFAGKRLPTETEWEKAAVWDGTSGRKSRYPWGDRPPTPQHTRLRFEELGTAPVGTCPDGASPSGALDMIGNVWEWTSSSFEAYPGFEAFPYREYSEEFFAGPYKVLRGGSWATAPAAVDSTFRNWDYPQRSQIFSGFRCARDSQSGNE